MLRTTLRKLCTVVNTVPHGVRQEWSNTLQALRFYLDLALNATVPQNNRLSSFVSQGIRVAAHTVYGRWAGMISDFLLRVERRSMFWLGFTCEFHVMSYTLFIQNATTLDDI